MDTFSLLAQGLLTALEPMNLLYALIGVTLGTAVGVLPSIGPALTVALLLPVTYKLDPGSSLIMFAGIYYAGMYGASTTSILPHRAMGQWAVEQLELNRPRRPRYPVTKLECTLVERDSVGPPPKGRPSTGSAA